MSAWKMTLHLDGVKQQQCVASSNSSVWHQATAVCVIKQQQCVASSNSSVWRPAIKCQYTQLATHADGLLYSWQG
jgi:hypothetical protein